jgi:hypothetical protein
LIDKKKKIGKAATVFVFHTILLWVIIEKANICPDAPPFSDRRVT